jgi:hypothetical protein
LLHLISIWLYGTELAAGKLQCRDIDGWAYSVGAELAEQQAATSHRAVFSAVCGAVVLAPEGVDGE